MKITVPQVERFDPLQVRNSIELRSTIFLVLVLAKRGRIEWGGSGDKRVKATKERTNWTMYADEGDDGQVEQVMEGRHEADVIQLGEGGT